MKHLQILFVSIAAAANLHAEGLTNVFSFTEETKVKGPFTEVGGELYFASEKGGQSNYGYIGKFNPANSTLTPLHHFASETKVKGGLTRANTNELWFVCERGGAANWGYFGSFDLRSNSITVLHEFTTETKPKTAPANLDGNNWYVLTDRGGVENSGFLGRYTPGNGFSIAASFTTNTGIKFEAPLVAVNGKLYYASREGGDITQLAGKGAGAIGTVDLTNGTVTKLIDLNAANHGAKIRSLVPFNDRLYFTAEEGGDLSLNNSKGWGTLGWFDSVNNSAARFFLCDDTTTGRKPRGLVAAGDRLYFNCGEGGPTTYGTFGCVTNGTNAFIAGVNTEAVGAKSDGGMTRHGQFIYFTTELGCANFLGGISAYELPAVRVSETPVLVIRRAGGNLELSWNDSACMLERCDNLTAGTWSVIAGPGDTSATVLIGSGNGFFRLRREAE